MHRCEYAREICAAQTGHIHVSAETLGTVLAIAAVLVAARLVYGHVRPNN